MHFETVKARSVVFTFITFFELSVLLSIHSNEPFWTKGFLSNRYLILALLLGIWLQLIALYSPLAGPMGTTGLNIYDWLVILSLSFACFLILEVVKVLKTKR